MDFDLVEQDYVALLVLERRDRLNSGEESFFQLSRVWSMCIEERNFRPIRRESEKRADSFLYFFREAAEMAHFTV
jgi:hypothetical protein